MIRRVLLHSLSLIIAALPPAASQAPSQGIPQAAIAPTLATSTTPIVPPVQPQSLAYQACTELQKSTTDEVAFPGGAHYSKENHRFWSRAASLKPQCIIFPTNAVTVAKTVQILNKYNTVPFAVKSGGHNGNPGFSNVDGGILIAMSRLAGVTYDPAADIVNVGPGMRWGPAIKSLERMGKTIVGGRVGDVGVGGYLVQGGLSFLSAQYGLACSNVVEFEIVTATGSIEKVTAASNPELFFALRGGGNQFGIVTNFKVKAYRMDQVWGGVKLIPGSGVNGFFSALRNFAEESDPKAAIIGIVGTGAGKHAIGLALFYDSPKPPPNAWGGLSAIPGKVIGSTQTYSSYLNTFSKGNNLPHVSIAMEEITLPVLPSPHGERLLFRVHERFDLVHKALRNKLNVLEINMAYQPITRNVLRETQIRGRTAIGIDPQTAPLIFIEMDVIYGGTKPSPKINTILGQYRAEISQYIQEEHSTYVKAMQALNQTITAYSPLYLPNFMNDAGSAQNVSGSYTAFEELGRIQRKYDPDGLFNKRTGGWKFN